MPQRFVFAAVGIGMFALVGCSGTTPGVAWQPGVVTVAPPISKNPVVANSIAAAVQALTLLERVALQYTSSPHADPVLKERIKQYDRYAYDAVMKARRNEATLDFALAAINAFQAVIP